MEQAVAATRPNSESAAPSRDPPPRDVRAHAGIPRVLRVEIRQSAGARGSEPSDDGEPQRRGRAGDDSAGFGARIGSGSSAIEEATACAVGSSSVVFAGDAGVRSPQHDAALSEVHGAGSCSAPPQGGHPSRRARPAPAPRRLRSRGRGRRCASSSSPSDTSRSSDASTRSRCRTNATSDSAATRASARPHPRERGLGQHHQRDTFLVLIDRGSRRPEDQVRSRRRRSRRPRPRRWDRRA